MKLLARRWYAETSLEESSSSNAHLGFRDLQRLLIARLLLSKNYFTTILIANSKVNTQRALNIE